jgi:hypothetical protein
VDREPAGAGAAPAFVHRKVMTVGRRPTNLANLVEK